LGHHGTYIYIGDTSEYIGTPWNTLEDLTNALAQLRTHCNSLEHIKTHYNTLKRLKNRNIIEHCGSLWEHPEISFVTSLGGENRHGDIGLVEVDFDKASLDGRV